MPRGGEGEEARREEGHGEVDKENKNMVKAMCACACVCVCVCVSVRVWDLFTFVDHIFALPANQYDYGAQQQNAGNQLHLHSFLLRSDAREKHSSGINGNMCKLTNTETKL